MQPQEIRKIPDGSLKITWSDSLNAVLSAEVLRRGCPCASCKEARGEGAAHAAPLTARKGGSLLRIVQASLESELKIEKVYPVGNYAIGIRWGDGHDTGIFTFEYLRQLGGQSA